VIDELMGHHASRTQDRSGSTIGLRYWHMTLATQARIVAVIDEYLAAAQKVLELPQ
jgi:hypothetical protein